MKRGIPFRAVIEFTDEEWEDLIPIEEVRSSVRINNAKMAALDVVVDEDSKSFLISAEDTSQWIAGKAEFDVLVYRVGISSPVPLPQVGGFPFQVTGLPITPFRP